MTIRESQKVGMNRVKSGANVNGTGSASANALLMQAIFRMGIPVSGKNLFPSNIQGLPTWYEIRVNAGGHTARTARYDLMVAMNAETYAADIDEVRSGGWVLPSMSIETGMPEVPRFAMSSGCMLDTLSWQMQRVIWLHGCGGECGAGEGSSPGRGWGAPSPRRCFFAS